jgi:hypothetical protein
MKNKKQNAVKTSTEMNIVAAVLNDTLRDAEVHFRALQHANGRGTTESQYGELEKAWINKVGLHNYLHGTQSGIWK